MHTLIDTELVVNMETCQLLSIESFSHSWLVNIPSFESFEESFGASIDYLDEASLFIEMDPKLPASRRFFGVSRELDFDFPTSDTPVTLVHADELISNGFLVPLFAKKSKKIEPYDDEAYSTPSTPVSSYAHNNVGSDSKVCCMAFKRCRRFSKRILKKYWEHVTPLFQKFCGQSSCSKSKADDGKKQEAKRFISSSPTSPRMSVAYSADNWRMSCDYESSIHEAVLHCKRSIGN